MTIGKPGKFILPLIGIALLAGAGLWNLAMPRTPEDMLQRQAEEYVVLALSLGLYKEGEVDAYFGPPEFLEKAGDEQLSPADILARANTLTGDMAVTEHLETPALAQRRSALLDKVTHLITLTNIIAGSQKPGFAEEIDALYGITLPEPDQDYEAILAELETLLPGKGSLAFKLASYQNKLLVPADKRQAVFEAAMTQCRERTAAYWQLPAQDTLEIDWTRDVQAAWHEYHGSYRSSLRINALTVAFVSNAVDLACHELYPGHHAQFLLLEQDGGMAIEDTVVLLRSPGSVLREGAANAGIELVFSPAQRLAFERDVLFPLAGLPREEAETSVRIHQLVMALSGAIVPVIEDYYDGDIDFNSASFRLEREAMVTSPLPLLEYVNAFGTYSMGYTVVRDLLIQHIDSRASTDDGARWALLNTLLVNPPATSLAIIQGD